MTTATSNANLVLKKIKELPPLPLVIQKLLAVMEDENSSAQDISNVLAGDQALAAKVLKLVNSSFFGLSGEVSTISRAVVILGVGSIRNLALSLSVAQIMATGEKGELQQKFWEHSIITAAAAETVALNNGYEDPEEAFIAGLLHDIGQLIFLMALPKEYIPLLKECPPDLLEQEKVIMGMSHARAGQKLLKHWKLPRALEQATRFHHNGPIISGTEDSLASIVAMGDSLAGVYGSRYENPLAEEDFLKLLKVTGLDVNTLGEMLQTIASRSDETRSFLKIATDGDLEAADSGAGEQLEVCLICTDQVKATWTQQILHHFGHEMVPMNQFFANAPGGEIPNLVILDPASISDEQLAKMKPVLDLARDVLVLFGDDGDGRVSTALGHQPPRLPFGFSRQDLIIGN